MKTPLSKFTLKQIEEELKVRGQRLDKKYPKVKKEIEGIINEWKRRNPIFVQSLLKFIKLEKLIDQQYKHYEHDINYDDSDPLSYQDDEVDYIVSVRGKELKKVEFRKPGYDEDFNNGDGYYEEVAEYFSRMWNRWCLVTHEDAVYYGDDEDDDEY